MVLLFIVAGAASQQTGQFDFAVLLTWSCLQHIVEGSGMSFPSHLNSSPQSVPEQACEEFWSFSHVCFVIEFINVVCLLLWIHAACKQVAKYQQDEFSPPPIPTPKPYRTGQGQQQSKQMFYICCAFWVQAVLIFFPFFYLDCVAVGTNFFFSLHMCLIAGQTTVWLCSMLSKVRDNNWCLYFCKKTLEVTESFIAIG